MRLRLPASQSPGWVLIESVAAPVFSLVSMLAIGRVIGPEATGTGTVAIAAFLMLEVLGAVIFTDALVQLPGLARRHADSAVTAAVLLGGAMGLALAGAAPLLAAGAGAPEVLWLVLALAPLLPLSAFSGAASGLVLRGQRFRLLAMRLLLGQPLALAVGLGLGLAGHGPWAMVAAQAASTLATFLLLLRFGRLRLRPALDRGALRALWPVAGPQLLGVTLNVGRYRIFLLALGLVLPSAALALSHFAFRLLDAALGVVWQAAGRLALPRLCAQQHDRAALAETYGDIAQLQALLGLPLSAGIALTAPEVVQVLLGPAWAGTAQATQIVGVAAMAMLLHGDQSSLFVALGKARRNAQVAVATLAVPLLALLALRPETPAGASLAWSAQCVVLPPVLAALVLRELRRPPLWLARKVAPAVAATLAMALVVLALRDGLDLPPGLRLLAMVPAGAATYAGVAWLLLGRRLPRALLAAPRTPAVPA